MTMTRPKLSLLLGMTTSLFAMRCGSDSESPFTDAGGRAGSGTSGSAGTTGGSVTAGSVGTDAGSGGSAGSTPSCTPEATAACTAENGCEGTKVCLTDGSGFGACECGSGEAGEGGAPASTGGAGTGGTDAGAAGRGDIAGGAPSDGGSGGAPSGGTPGEGGESSGGAAGITSGGEGGAGGSGQPVTIEITDLVDTYVEECRPNQSHGSAIELLVDTDPCVYQAYVAPAEPLALSAGAQVKSAILRFYCDNAGADVSVYAVGEAWNETTLDWNSRPDLGELQGAFTPAVGVMELDLTNLVQSWVDAGTAFGIAFTQTADDGSDYASTEAADTSQRPVLTITYTP
jgi:hypothetical protein